MEKNFYLILGLPEHADQEAIRKRYKELVKQYHPDRYGKDRVPFQDIQEAYSVLADEEKKKKYDASLEITPAINKPAGKHRMGCTRDGIPVEPLAPLGYEDYIPSPFSKFKSPRRARTFEQHRYLEPEDFISSFMDLNFRHRHPSDLFYRIRRILDI